MSLRRLGVVNPPKNVETKLADVNTQYFSSVIVTNLNPVQTANITIYVKPRDEEDPDNYAYLSYLFPLSKQNSFETIRFAMNPLDEIWVESSVDDISFMAMGIPQSVIAVRYSVGELANRPTTPQPGDQYYNTTSNVLQLYKPTGWVTVTTS
jgi:hypothetical protein